MAKIRILQINCNRSFPAKDMALAVAKEEEAALLVLSEPNKRAIQNRKDWVYDDDLHTAIKVLDANIVATDQGTGIGYSYVATPSFAVYGCYASLNRTTEDLDDYLQEIGGKIRARKEEAIIVGDFNVKSLQWGTLRTDNREKVVTEWIAEHELIIKNVGNKPTFERQGYDTILDLTLTTTGISGKIDSWKVSENRS